MKVALLVTETTERVLHVEVDSVDQEDLEAAVEQGSGELSEELGTLTRTVTLVSVLDYRNRVETNIVKAPDQEDMW